MVGDVTVEGSLHILLGAVLLRVHYIYCRQHYCGGYIAYNVGGITVEGTLHILSAALVLWVD